MSIILSIETSTTVCSVALHQDEKLVANQSLHMAQSHSGLLVPVINQLLEYTEISKNQLSAIALSKGPGSYTGLRIGTSTAKGLCHALDIPLIGINTLEAMAGQIIPFVKEPSVICPMLDARRMEVYSMLLNEKAELIEPTKAIIIDETSLKDYLQEHKVFIFGNGASKCKKVIKSPNALFIDNIEPDAVNVGKLAIHKYNQSQFEDLIYFNPFYLKDFRVTKPKQK